MLVNQKLRRVYRRRVQDTLKPFSWFGRYWWNGYPDVSLFLSLAGFRHTHRLTEGSQINNT